MDVTDLTALTTLGILYDTKGKWILNPTRKGQQPAYKDNPEKDEWMWYVIVEGGEKLKLDTTACLQKSSRPPRWLNIYQRLKWFRR